MIYEGKTLELKDLVNRKFVEEFITANPEQAATVTLSKIKIGNVYYGVFGLPTVTSADVGKSVYVNNSGVWETGYVSNTYQTIITGDGVTSEFTINHNLNTKDVVVQVYEMDDDCNTILTNVSRPTTTSVKIKFGSARTSGSTYKVICIGISNTAMTDYEYANGKNFGN